MYVEIKTVNKVTCHQPLRRRVEALVCGAPSRPAGPLLLHAPLLRLVSNESQTSSSHCSRLLYYTICHCNTIGSQWLITASDMMVVVGTHTESTAPCDASRCYLINYNVYSSLHQWLLALNAVTRVQETAQVIFSMLLCYSKAGVWLPHSYIRSLRRKQQPIQPACTQLPPTHHRWWITPCWCVMNEWRNAAGYCSARVQCSTWSSLLNRA